VTRLAGLFLAVLTFSAADFIGPRAAAQTSRASPNVGRSDDKSPSIVPEIARRMDSPQHPMPLIPVLVPQIKTAQELDEVLTGKIPTLFYLTQAEGPDAGGLLRCPRLVRI